MKMNNPHPWAAFLNARYKAIIWMREVLGYSDELIAYTLSMDETQVYLIRTSGGMPLPEGTNDCPIQEDKLQKQLKIADEVLENNKQVLKMLQES